MKYCCKEFESKVNAYIGFDKQEDGTWSISGCTQCYIVHGMKFCPFCGKQLTTKFMVEASNIHGYHVWLNGKAVAHFETKGEAEEYVLLH